MAIVTQRHPYEFLVRWKDGVLSGAHVRWLYRTTGDGMEPVEAESAALPVAVGTTEGFPLGDILTEVTSSAVTALQEAQAALAAMTARATAAEAALKDAQRSGG